MLWQVMRYSTLSGHFYTTSRDIFYFKHDHANKNKLNIYITFFFYMLILYCSLPHLIIPSD